VAEGVNGPSEPPLSTEPRCATATATGNFREIENLRRKSLAGLTPRSYQKCDAGGIVSRSSSMHCLASRRKAIAAKRLRGRRKTGNLWSPLEHSRKSMSYILRSRKRNRDDIENNGDDDVARNARL